MNSNTYSSCRDYLEVLSVVGHLWILSAPCFAALDIPRAAFLIRRSVGLLSEPSIKALSMSSLNFSSKVEENYVGSEIQVYQISRDVCKIWTGSFITSSRTRAFIGFCRYLPSHPDQRITVHTLGDFLWWFSKLRLVVQDPNPLTVPLRWAYCELRQTQ